MDHKAFLKSLDMDLRVALNEKSDLIGLAHLIVHWGLIGLVGFLIIQHVAGWQALLFVQGVLLIFLFTLLHETCHLTPFKSARLNLIVGHICGFLIFLPATHFRYFHLAHHRYTQDPERDPELAGKKPETLLQYCWHLTGLPVWYFHGKTILINAFGKCNDDFVPKGQLGNVTTEARIMLVLYACISVATFVSGIYEILYVWLIPLLLGQPFLRLYLMAEHGRCPQVSNMFENTRTTFTSFLIRKLAWNMPYHTEHHVCPTVPFYKLPELHTLSKSYLKETENGYAEFHRKTISDFKK